MAKRHNNAIAIQLGACNPSGIAHAIIEACREMRGEPNHKGTAEICSDAAVRLMVHQLAFLCRASEIDASLTLYGELSRACEDIDNADAEARDKAERRTESNGFTRPLLVRS
jgi:hypothetical protein